MRLSAAREPAATGATSADALTAGAPADERAAAAEGMHAAARRAAAPVALDLPRLVMRRAAWVALAVLVGALVLGLLRVGRDVDTEVEAALSLAQLVAGVSSLATMDDAAAMAALRALPAATPTRHLVLRVRTPSGVMVLGEADVDRTALSAPDRMWRFLLDQHRRWFSRLDRQTVSWALPRPRGGPWVVSLSAASEAERAEALANLLGMLAMLVLCVAGLLLVMRWNVRRAFAPLGTLLHAIAGIEHNDSRAVRALAPMPIGELEAVAGALRRLAAALDVAEAERRVLGQRVITLQEDERARLARDLHDEFGQQLTALRADAAWLARRLGSATDAAAGPGSRDAAAAEVARGLGAHVQRIQQELRAVLARLRPDGEAASLDALARMLATLVDGWAAHPGVPHRVGLALQAADATGRIGPWPADAADIAVPAALSLAVYRITQEALTNIARHADARHAEVRLVWRGDERALDWSVEDDGVGVADVTAALVRGTGLAGLKERVWALDAELQIGPLPSALASAAGRPGGADRSDSAAPGAAANATANATATATATPANPHVGAPSVPAQRPGLRLHARLHLPAAAGDTAARGAP